LDANYYDNYEKKRTSNDKTFVFFKEINKVNKKQ